jgi:nucleoside 2-deoxyribosyltransferase
LTKIVYLANPYGFSKQQNQLLLPPIVRALEALGAEVWEPFGRSNQVDFSKAGWAYQVAQADVKDVKACDGIFAIVNGTPPDEGVMVELGMAIALNKAIFLFRDDLRRCTDSEDYPLNLMLFAGLPAIGWEAYYYTSVEEISAPDKALYRWLAAEKEH